MKCWHLQQVDKLFVVSKNGKFRDSRSFFKPSGDDFRQKCPFLGENQQKRLRTASKMTSYLWISHSLRPQKFVYLLSTLQLTGLIEKSHKKKMKNFELQCVENSGSTVFSTAIDDSYRGLLYIQYTRLFSATYKDSSFFMVDSTTTSVTVFENNTKSIIFQH